MQGMEDRPQPAPTADDAGAVAAHTQVVSCLASGPNMHEAEAEAIRALAAIGCTVEECLSYSNLHQFPPPDNPGAPFEKWHGRWRFWFSAYLADA